jgi:hypothetical protein
MDAADRRSEIPIQHIVEFLEIFAQTVGIGDDVNFILNGHWCFS